MRIVIDVKDGRDAHGKKAVLVTTWWQRHLPDSIRTHDCGVDLYNEVVKAFSSPRLVRDGLIVNKGEVE